MKFLSGLLYLPIYKRQIKLPDGTSIDHDVYAVPLISAIALLVKMLK